MRRFPWFWLLLAAALLLGISALFWEGEPPERDGGDRPKFRSEDPDAKNGNARKTPSRPPGGGDAGRTPAVPPGETYEFQGKVQSSAGAPVAKAEISLWIERVKPDPAARPLFRAETDAAGRFRLAGVPRGQFFLEAQKTGFSQERLYGIEVPRERSADIVLFPAAVLFGAMRERSTGKGLPRVLLRLDYEKEAGVIEHGPELFADGEGKFRVDGARAGDFSLLISAEKEGYARVASREPPLALGESREVEIFLSPGQRLEGLVLDDEGKPLVGAAVALVDEAVQAVVSQVESGEFGRFSMPEIVLESIYSLQASKLGYRSGEIAALRFPAGTLVLRLERNGSIAGEVRDEGGAPVEFFKVKAFREATLGYREGEVEQFFRDRRGSFVLDSIPPGELGLLVSADGFAPARIEKLKLAPGGRVAGVSVVLRRGGTARGTVVQPNGKPVPGARVTLAESTASGQIVGAFGAGVETDANGQFSLGGIPEGYGFLRVRKEGFPEALAGFRRQGEPSLDLGRIVLARGGAVEGACLGPYGEPLQRFVVEAVAAPRLESGRVQSDSSGRYRLENLPPGAVTLTGYYPGRLPGVSPLHRFHRTIELAEGQTAEADFDYRKGGKIVGRVLGLDPESPADLLVNLLDAAGRTVEGSAAVDSLGEFAIDAVSGGEYELLLRSPTRDFAASRWIRIAEGERLEVVFQIGRGRIAGIVTDEQGRPLAGASLIAKRQGADGFGFQASAGEKGEFVLEGIEPGVYRLEFSMEGFGPEVVPSYRVEASDGEPLRIRLGRASSLKLRVRSPSGQALAGIPIHLERKGDPEFPGSGVLESDDEGWTVWGNLREGDYSAQPLGKEIFPSALDIHLGAGAQAAGEIFVRRRGNLRVQLRYGEQHMLKDIQVTAVLKGAEFAGDSLVWAKAGKILVQPAGGFTDAAGSILFIGLPEGGYEVLILGGVQKLNAVVQAGKTTELFADL